MNDDLSAAARSNYQVGRGWARGPRPAAVWRRARRRQGVAWQLRSVLWAMRDGHPWRRLRAASRI